MPTRPILRRAIQTNLNMNQQQTICRPQLSQAATEFNPVYKSNWFISNIGDRIYDSQNNNTPFIIN